MKKLAPKIIPTEAFTAILRSKLIQKVSDKVEFAKLEMSFNHNKGIRSGISRFVKINDRNIRFLIVLVPRQKTLRDKITFNHFWKLLWTKNIDPEMGSIKHPPEFFCAWKIFVYLKKPSPPSGQFHFRRGRRLRVRRWMPKRWHQWISLRQWIPVRRGGWTNGWLDVRCEFRRRGCGTRFGNALLLFVDFFYWRHLKRNDAKLSHGCWWWDF